MMMAQHQQTLPEPKVLWDTVAHYSVLEILDETDSVLALDADGSAVQISITSPDGLRWFMYRLRDRGKDGPGWEQSRLVNWSYCGEDDREETPAVEESIYMLDPRYPLLERYSPETANFIVNPFEMLPETGDKYHLRQWLDNWLVVFKEENPILPGWFATKNIRGVRSYIHRRVLNVLSYCGYEKLTAVPTWWHTCKTDLHLGFKFVKEEDKATFAKLERFLGGLWHLPGMTPSKLSWLVMLQFWLEKADSRLKERVQDNYIFMDESTSHLVTYPLSPEKNLWLSHPVK